ALDVTGTADDAPDAQTYTRDEMAETKSGSETVERLDNGSATRNISQKKSYLEELQPWSPGQKEVNLLGSFLRPWATWCYPSIVWSVFSFSIHVTWSVQPLGACYCFESHLAKVDLCSVVVMITLIPIYLGGPPYNFTTSQQGLVFLSP